MTALAESLQMPKLAELERARAELESRLGCADAALAQQRTAAATSSRELEETRRWAAAEVEELRARGSQAAAEAARRESTLLAEVDEIASRS